mgnify:FL=1
MYKGKRDDHITLRVPQDICFEFMSSKTGLWIEVVIAQNPNGTWDSFMVRSKQVCFDHLNPDKYNIIEEINRYTDIMVCTKQTDPTAIDGRRIVPNTERYFDPFDLFKLFAHCN